MIIKTFELQKIKKNKVKIFLLYGENDGFKNQFINEFFVKNFTFFLDFLEFLMKFGKKIGCFPACFLG